MKKLIPALCVAAAGLLWADGEMTVDEAQAKSHIVSRVDPEYPVVARQMRVTGKIALNAFVEPDGTVSKVEPVIGNPLLTQSGVKAVKRWKFAPFSRDGKPVKAIAPVSLDFRL